MSGCSWIINILSAALGAVWRMKTQQNCIEGLLAERLTSNVVWSGW